jgi:superfamily II DNA helicase RecQ
VDLLDLLQKFFPNNPDVQFKSPGQKEMVAEAVSRTRNFIGVLPTGGGKSLVFMLPAFVEDGLWTIVLTPNKMLLRDHLRRAQEAQIPALQWTVNSPPQENIRIWFVALETTASKKFKMYVVPCQAMNILFTLS